jgi:exocyst complex protein 7
MALSEYFTALDGVIGDLERMWRGVLDGRGGAREAGVRDLVRFLEQEKGKGKLMKWGHSRNW